MYKTKQINFQTYNRYNTDIGRDWQRILDTPILWDLFALDLTIDSFEYVSTEQLPCRVFLFCFFK